MIACCVYTAGSIALTEWDQRIQEPQLPSISFDDITWTAPILGDSAASHSPPSAGQGSSAAAPGAAGAIPYLLCSCSHSPGCVARCTFLLVVKFGFMQLASTIQEPAAIQVRWRKQLARVHRSTGILHNATAKLEVRRGLSGECMFSSAVTTCRGPGFARRQSTQSRAHWKWYQHLAQCNLAVCYIEIPS